MDLQIITPDTELFNGQAKRVNVPGVDGSMGFLDNHCLLYTSDAADERSRVDLGGRRIITKKKRHK
mgnify:CR=1 FL=1